MSGHAHLACPGVRGPAEDRTTRSTLLDMVTIRPAQALGLGADHGLEVERPADLVVMESTSAEGLVVDRPERVLVLKAGRITATGPSARQLGVEGPEV